MTDFKVDPEEEFHVVLGGQVMALSLDRLDDYYQSDVIDDATLIWQPTFPEWLRLDVVLAKIAENEPVAPAPTLPSDVYYVMLGPGEVKTMSLEQLDDSYRLDVIALDTLVWQEGYTEWVPLGVLLGADDEPAVSIAPSLAPAMPATRANWALPSEAPRAPSFAPLASTTPRAPSYAPLASSPASRPVPHGSASPVSPSSRAPTSALGSISVGDSLGPVAQSTRPLLSFDEPVGPILVPTASPWFGRSLSVLAAATLLLVLHRNGVTDAVAAEASGPNAAAQPASATDTDTPHGLARWLTHLDATYGLQDLSPTESSKPAAAPAPEVEAAPSPGPEAAKPAVPKPSPAPAAAPAKANPSEKQPSKEIDAFNARLLGGPAISPAPQVKSSAASKSSVSSKPKASKSKANQGAAAYDPMNGTL